MCNEKIDAGSASRFTLVVIAAANAVLNLLGCQTISDELINDLVTVISGFILLWGVAQ